MDSFSGESTQQKEKMSNKARNIIDTIKNDLSSEEKSIIVSSLALMSEARIPGKHLFDLLFLSFT